jgi:hypothetical protein
MLAPGLGVTPWEGAPVVSTTELVDEDSAPHADNAATTNKTAAALFDFIVSA